MAQNPEIQRKCQAEIDRVVGREREVTMEDRPSMPYIEACILETLRLVPIAPQNLMHSNLRDVEYRGYLIPAGSWVMGHIYGVQRDPK